MKTKALVKKLLVHIAIILFGLLMFYPIVWLFFASFKESAEVLNSYKILPETFHFENYVTGWHLVYPYTFDRFFLNSFMLVILCIIGSLMISLVVGYGFKDFYFLSSSLRSCCQLLRRLFQSILYSRNWGG